MIRRSVSVVATLSLLLIVLVGVQVYRQSQALRAATLEVETRLNDIADAYSAVIESQIPALYASKEWTADELAKFTEITKAQEALQERGNVHEELQQVHALQVALLQLVSSVEKIQSGDPALETLKFTMSWQGEPRNLLLAYNQSAHEWNRLTDERSFSWSANLQESEDHLLYMYEDGTLENTPKVDL